MAQVSANQQNWLVAVNKILPEIEYFLRNDLSKESLSDFSNERRVELLRRLEEIISPPNLPPRKPQLKRVNTSGQIGSSTLVVTPESQRKFSDGILSTKVPGDHDKTAEFIEIQREISRKWGHNEPGLEDFNNSTADELEDVSVTNSNQSDSVSNSNYSSIYERILSDDSASANGSSSLHKAANNGIMSPGDLGNEDVVSPPPVPDRTTRGRLKHPGKGWSTAEKRVTEPVLVHSLKEPAYSGPLKDLRAGEKLWCVLKHKNLYFFRSLVVPAHEVVSMSEYDIHFDNLRKTMFRLNKPGFPSFLLAADNESEFEKWIAALEKCKYEELHVTPPVKEMKEMQDELAKENSNDGEDGYQRPEELLKKFEEQRRLKLRQQEFERSVSSDQQRSPGDYYVDMSGKAGTPTQPFEEQPPPDPTSTALSPPQNRDTYYMKKSLPPIPGSALPKLDEDADRKGDDKSDDNSLSGGFDSLDSDDGETTKGRGENNAFNQERTKKLQEKKGKAFDFFHDLDAVYCGVLHQRRILAVWQKRYCKLKDDALICRRNPDNGEKPVLEIPLQGCRLEMAAKETRRTTAFKLRRPNDDILYFAAETRDHLMKWLTVLAQIIDKNMADKAHESESVAVPEDRKRLSQISTADTNSVDSREYQMIDDFFDDKGALKAETSESDFDADTESDGSSESEEEGAESNNKVPRSSEFGTVKSKIIRKLRRKNRMSAGSSDEFEDTEADIRGYLYRFQNSRWCRRWCVIKHKKFLVFKKASVHHPEETLQLEHAVLFANLIDEHVGVRYNLFQLKPEDGEPVIMSSVSRTDLEIWKSILINLVKEVNKEEEKRAPLPPPPWCSRRTTEIGATTGKDGRRRSSQISERKSADVSTLHVNGKITEIKYKSGKPTEVERWFSLIGRELKIFTTKDCLDPLFLLDLRQTLVRRMRVEDEKTGYMFSFEFVKDRQEKTIDFKIDEETQNTLTPVLWASEAQLVGFETMTLDRRRKHSYNRREGCFDDNIGTVREEKAAFSYSNRARSEEATLTDDLYPENRRGKSASVPESILQAALPGVKGSHGDLNPRSKTRASALPSERPTSGNRVSKLFKSLTSDRRHKKNKYRLAKEEEEKPVDFHPKEQFHGRVEEIKKASDGSTESIPRYCRVSGKIFYAFDIGKLLKPIFKVPLRNAVLEDRVDADAKLYTINITSMEDNTEFHFNLSSEQELDLWLAALTEPNYVSLTQSSKESLLSDEIDNKSKSSDTSAKDQADAVSTNASNITPQKAPSASSDERKLSSTERKKSRESDSTLERTRLEGFLFESKSSDLTTTKVRQWAVLKKTRIELYDSKKGKRVRVLLLTEFSFTAGNADDRKEKLKLILKSEEETITFICNDEKQHQEWAKELKRLTRRRTRIGSDSAKSLLKSTSGSLKQLLVKSDSGKSKRATLLLDDGDQEAVEKYVDFLNPINSLSGPLRQAFEDGSTKERFCFIQDNYFYVCKANKPEKRLQKINLTAVTVLDESDASIGKFVFKLDDGKGKSAVFECQDAQSADRWMVAVSMAMLLDKLQFGGSRVDLQKSASDYEFLTFADSPKNQKKTGALSTLQETVGIKSSTPAKRDYRKSSSADDLLRDKGDKLPSPPPSEISSHSLSDLTLIITDDEQNCPNDDGKGTVNESVTGADIGRESVDGIEGEESQDTRQLAVSPVMTEGVFDRRGSKDSLTRVDDLLRNKEILESERYTLQRCLSELKTVVDESRSRRRLSRSSSSSSVKTTIVEEELRTAKSDFQKMKKRLAFVDKELKKVSNEINRRYNKSYWKHISSSEGQSGNKWYTDTSCKEGGTAPFIPSTSDDVFDGVVDSTQDFII